MVVPTIKRQILSDLDRLSPEQQQRAAELVRGLVAQPLTGGSGRDLLPFAGTLDGESARMMAKVIEEGCERVDVGDW